MTTPTPDDHLKGYEPVCDFCERRLPPERLHICAHGAHVACEDVDDCEAHWPKREEKSVAPVADPDILETARGVFNELCGSGQYDADTIAAALQADRDAWKKRDADRIASMLGMRADELDD